MKISLLCLLCDKIVSHNLLINMNTKTVLKDQGLMPANSQAQEMMIVGFISLWVVLAAVLYFS